MSCCRTESLGFISSPNRMNVALTRARRHLILVGSGRTLPKNQCWNQIIDQARSAPGGYFNSRAFQMSGYQYQLAKGFNCDTEILSTDISEDAVDSEMLDLDTSEDLDHARIYDELRTDVLYQSGCPVPASDEHNSSTTILADEILTSAAKSSSSTGIAQALSSVPKKVLLNFDLDDYD